jgi:hypothetical protein
VVLATTERSNGKWVPGYWRTDEDRNEPPRVDEILSLWREGQQYYQGFHAQCKVEEEYYNGLRKIPVPEGIDPIWPATANAIINVATDHVDVNNLTIDVPSSPRSRARAEKLKRFYQGVWLSIKDPILRTCVRQSFMYGLGFLKDMYASDQWPDGPTIDQFGDDTAAYKKELQDFLDRRQIAFPFEVMSPRATNLIWDDSRTRMKWCIEFSERRVRDIARRYPEWTKGKDSTSIGQWMEYWDEEWVAYLMDDEIVWGPHKHGYGHLPYTPLYPANSYTFEDGLPQDRFRGILYPVHSLLDSEARLVSQLEAMVRSTAWRTLDFQGAPSQAEKARDSYEIFGGMNVLPPGVTVAVSPMVNVGQDLFAELNIVQTLIEQATFPNVIRGIRPRGVSTGFAVSVLAGMGRLVFQGVADGLRHTIEQANSKFAQLVENKIKGRVTVHGRTEVHSFDQSIEPDDIRGYYENVVQVKAEAPEEREREALLAMRLLQSGVISLYEAQRRSGIINPLEEQLQQRAEQLMNSPVFMEAQVQLLMERVGLLPQLAAAAGAPEQAGINPGSMNLGGAQLPRPGERNIQQGRVASQQGQPSVFPQGFGGLDSLGANIGGAQGGAQGLPSGQTVRR